VALVALVALFLAREVFKYMRGVVELTARQKVVRVLGGALLMAVLLMLLFSPVALAPRPGLSHQARSVLALGYWGAALALSVLTLLMAVMDVGEVSRQYTRARKDIRSSTLTQDDIDRLIAAQRRDHPDDIGRGPTNGGNSQDDGHRP
jgi:hypothetical protein